MVCSNNSSFTFGVVRCSAKSINNDRQIYGYGCTPNKCQSDNESMGVKDLVVFRII